MSVVSEIQKLNASPLITLFELDLSEIAPELTGDDRYLRFSNSTNEKGESIIWNNKTYTSYPIIAEGFGVNAQGAPPRPTIKAANINFMLTDFCQAYGDLVKAKLTRIRTFERFLDTENFHNGNANADPSEHLPNDVYSVERKIEENNQFVQWELRWQFDLQGVTIPARPIIQNLCQTLYKSAECGWVPVSGSYFDINDNACDLVNDECSQRLTGCIKRFGRKSVLPYGAFPGAGVTRL